MEFEFNPSVDNIELVPTDFRGLYVEKDGKHVLNDDPAVKSAVSAISGLNRSLKASRGEVKALKGSKVDLSPLSDFGETPDAILESITERLAAAGSKGGKNSAEDMERKISKIKEDLATAHKGELDASNTRAETLKGQLYNHLVTSTARTALAEAGAIDSDLALPFLSAQVKVSEEDGKFAVNVVDSAGDPRYSGTTGSPMSVPELVAEMKGQEKYGPLFKSEKASGGGTQPDRGRQNIRKDVGDMTPGDKIKAGIAARQAGR